MSHFAKIENNTVTQVIVAEQDFIDTLEGNWIQTSYNTRSGIHYDSNTGLPSLNQSKSLRKNYAGIGFTYDETLDVFIPPKPYPSWLLNEETCNWNAPVPYPEDGNRYYWDEETGEWTKLEIEL